MKKSNTIRFSAAAVAMLIAGGCTLFAWDAGPVQCMHNVCSGGVTSGSVPDTQPRYANSVLPSQTCPAGKEFYGGLCYNQCPANYHRTAVLTCKKNNTGPLDLTALWTSAQFGNATPPQPSCPPGRELWGGLCYAACPPGSVRSAVSTCVHRVTWRANTHLWIVERALDLLGSSGDAGAINVVNRVRGRQSCKLAIEKGIWETDDGSLADTTARGSHFYNPAHLDWNGSPTAATTYLLVGVDQTQFGNARTNAQSHLAAAANIDTDSQCEELGKALHYMTDLTQPMHASSMSAVSIPTDLHPTLEDYAGGLQARFPADRPWDRRFTGLPADAVVLGTAQHSNGLAVSLLATLRYNGTICTMSSEPGLVYTGYCFLNDPNVEQKIGEALRDAYQETASWLYAAFRSAPVSSSSVAPVTPSVRRVAFRTSGGFYLTAENAGGQAAPNAIHTNRTAMGPWEIFTMRSIGNGNAVSLQTADGHYLTAEGGGGNGSVSTNRTTVGPWETFTLRSLPGGLVALQTANGDVVTAEGNGGGSGPAAVAVNRTAIGPWESFTLAAAQ